MRGARSHVCSPVLRLVVLASVAATLGLPQLASAQPALLDTGEAPLRPFEVLLQHQEALGLTADQLHRLGRVRERLVRTNEPLVTRMLALRGQWQREAVLEDGRPDARRRERIRRAAEAARAQIARNNRTAMQAVNRVLTPAQRAALRAIVQARQIDDAGPPGNEGSHAAGGD
jgi:Spy/CpxP family protein refolding chaperone